MRKLRLGKRRQSGQVLALVAVLLVALLAMLGLVLDGGRLYLERRHMQNAADAGAMAGARVLALGGTTDAGRSSAEEYAHTRNGADTCTTCISEPHIQVTACEDVPMTFARIIALDAVTVCARAAATWGGIGAMGGLAPVAVFDFGFNHCLPEDANPIDCTYSIWESDEDVDPVATHNIQGNARGWLSLDCRYPDDCQEGASKLKDYMVNGYPGVIEVDEYIRPASGTMSSVIAKASLGQVLWVPIWDGIEEKPKKPYYHIVAFAAFKVTKVHATGNPKGITGIFQDYVLPNHPPGPLDRGVKTAGLTE